MTPLRQHGFRSGWIVADRRWLGDGSGEGAILLRLVRSCSCVNSIGPVETVLRARAEAP